MDHLRTVAFPEAGEGVELFFRNSDILALRKEYGPEYLEHVENGLKLNFDMEIIERCLKAAGKKDGKPHPIGIDDLNGVTVFLVCQKILDAYSLSVNGRTFEEQLKWLADQTEKLASGKGDSPPTNPEASSPGSSEQPSGQESETPTSGT